MIKGLAFRYASRWRNLRYHFRNAPWADLRAFERQRSGRSTLPWPALIRASWRHGASFDDYYLLRFFEKNDAERRQYLTLSRLYELERQQHDLAYAQILRDKARFKAHFEPWLGRDSWTWPELQALPDTGVPPHKVVIKSRFGVRGRDLFFPAQRFVSWRALREHMRQTLPEPERYLCEAYIEQHPDLAALNPGTVNTLRIMTYCAAEQVQIWGTVLRIGCGSGPDNWAQGGVAAWVDDDGVIRRGAVPKDPFTAPLSHHPVNGQPIVGFAVPQITAARALALQAARALPRVPSVGWDVVVKADGGLCLLEGNDRWSYLLLQNTLGTGCRQLAAAVCDLEQVYV